MKNIFLAGKIVLFIIGCIALFACSKDSHNDTLEPTQEVNVDWSNAADSAHVSLVREFWNSTQFYFNQNNNGHTGFNYWWNAHAVDVMIDKYNRDKKMETIAFMDQLLAGLKAKNGNTLQNNFYDDMEWLALALLRAYDATRDVKYKNDAEYLWNLIKGGWTSVCGGGIMWEKNAPNSKNACSNGPAIIIAARLYQLNQNQDDLNWAKKIYDWEKANLVDVNTGSVWDGISYNSTTGQTTTNTSWIFTYNLGTFLGGALELYKITKDKSYLEQAKKTAVFAINSSKLNQGTVLTEGGTGDGGLFKGIFIRYFTQLAQCSDLDAGYRRIFTAYVKDNAVNMWTKATCRPQMIFDPHWLSVPAPKPGDCSIHLSGIMLLEAAAELKRNGFIQ